MEREKEESATLRELVIKGLGRKWELGSHRTLDCLSFCPHGPPALSYSTENMCAHKHTHPFTPPLPGISRNWS